MLKITIEIIPNGEPERAKCVGELEIVNDDTGNECTGHYDFVYRTFSERFGHESVAVARGHIADVERDIIRPEQLAGVAFGLIAPIKKTMSSWHESSRDTVHWDDGPTQSSL